MTIDNRQTSARTGAFYSKRIFWGGVIFAGIAIVIAANAHLVMVAFASQPACVEHQKERGAAPGAYRAAKSACASRPEERQ